MFVYYICLQNTSTMLIPLIDNLTDNSSIMLTSINAKFSRDHPSNSIVEPKDKQHSFSTWKYPKNLIFFSQNWTVCSVFPFQITLKMHLCK